MPGHPQGSNRGVKVMPIIYFNTTSYLSFNSTATLLAGSLRIGTKTSYLSSNSTGVKLNTKYLSGNSTGN